MIMMSPDELETATLEVVAHITGASNGTLLVLADCEGVQVPCVYKPVAGERPLWDFPDGTLAGREVATYIVAKVGGWNVVPTTVWVDDGPAGEGSLQQWVQPEIGDAVGTLPDGTELLAGPDASGLVDVALDVPVGWHEVYDGFRIGQQHAVLCHAPEDSLADLALLDVVINNADRKAGHIVPGPQGQLFGIDHGLTMHCEQKLRTVLWGFAGQPLPDNELAKLDALDAQFETLSDRLSGLLTNAEIDALAERIAVLRRLSQFPKPPRDYPAIPWPPF